MAKMWESDLKGAELLMAIAIADHADHEGECFPGLDSLASKLKLKKRQVQDLVDRLERKGIIKMTRGKGRGHKTLFQFQKVQDSAPIKPKEKVQESAIKGAVSCKEKVQFSASPSYKEEPLIEPIINREREPTPTAADFGPPRLGPPPKHKHPAIKAIFDITKSQPNRAIWDDLIDLLGDEPDVPRLVKCHKAWVTKGFKEKNLGWVTDWYVDGIPEKQNGTHQNGGGRYPAKPSIADTILGRDYYADPNGQTPGNG